MEKQRELPKSEQTRRRNLIKKAAKLDTYLSLEAFDLLFFRGNTRFVAGVDEAGRGALAGPVVAAAVVLPPYAALVGVEDSKKLREKAREEIFSEIVSKALAVGIAFRNSHFIDRHNILVATLSTMEEAVGRLRVKPDVVIVDGRDKIRFNGRVVAIPRGDGKSLAIASASVVAKVTRDRFMRKIHKKFPAYNFLRNKGYGTREHIEAISRCGMAIVHRKSYHVKGIEKIAQML